MKIKIIVAIAKNGVIGNSSTNSMPWDNISEDMQHFKQTTMSYPIIMGRKTFESFNQPQGLPGRSNIVISKTAILSKKIFGAASLHDALELAGFSEPLSVFIIGGGQVYADTIYLADELVVTHLPFEAEGDVKFPEIDPNVWEEVESRNSETVPGMKFVRYNRK